MFPRARARAYLRMRAIVKPILDRVPYRIRAIDAIIGIEKGALRRPAGGCKARARGPGCGPGPRGARPAMTGPDSAGPRSLYLFPRGRLACAPSQRRSLNNADSSGEMIASRYRTAIFFFADPGAAQRPEKGRRRVEDHANSAARFGTLPTVDALRSRIVERFASLSVFVNLSARPHLRGSGNLS